MANQIGNAYKTAPTHDELRAMGGDLRFRPCEVENPAALTTAQADIANGCMRFVAGSHLHGQLEFRQSDASENNVLNQTVDEVERCGAIVDIELKAGQISVHSDLLLHSSHYNESDRRRCGLTLRYCTPDVRAIPGCDWEKEGVLISGADPDGHWGNPPRPEWDCAVD